MFRLFTECIFPKVEDTGVQGSDKKEELKKPSDIMAVASSIDPITGCTYYHSFFRPKIAKTAITKLDCAEEVKGPVKFR